MSLAAKAAGHRFRVINIAGNAKVQLGDSYAANSDIFESGAVEDRHEALLNILHFEDIDTRRQQLSLAGIGIDSFEWVRTSRISEWLRTPSAPLFWISGKPGSGKSTLMKYLADSHWTLEALRGGALNNYEWKIVQFYFDYRARDALANQPLGMLKLFLRQLSDDIDLERTDLIKELLGERFTLERYVDLLSSALRRAKINVCAFVDGLDEFEGDLWELCTHLDALRDRTGMRMCLASRPESAFRVLLAEIPTISMQDHNEASIASYVSRKVAKAKAEIPTVEDLFSTSVQEAIRHKAEGVILWARLVVDEMMKTCNERTTAEELLLLLDVLPKELEELYNRILKRTNDRYQGEVSLIVHLLADRGGSQRKKLLYLAWNFFQVRLLGQKKPKGNIAVEAFDARITALLGNMIEFVGSNVRLMHKTLSTYLSRTSWLSDNMPRSFKQICPDHPWARLSALVIVDAAKQNAIASFANSEPLSADTLSPQWRPWYDLLEWALETYPETYLLGCAERYRFGLPISTRISEVMVLHYDFCTQCAYIRRSPWHQERVQRLRRAGLLHWVIEACHREYDWAQIQLGMPKRPLDKRYLMDFLDVVLVDIAPMVRANIHVQRRILISRLAHQGAYIQGYHLCSLEMTHDTSKWLEPCQVAQNFRTNRAWAHSHDAACIHHNSDISLIYHWCEAELFCYQHEWLRIFLQAGLDINASCSSHGSALLTILERLMRVKDARDFWKKFVALTKVNATTSFVGPNGNALSYVNKIRKSINQKKVLSEERQHFRLLDVIDRASSAIIWHMKTSSWPKLSEDTYFLSQPSSPLPQDQTFDFQGI